MRSLYWAICSITLGRTRHHRPTNKSFQFWANALTTRTSRRTISLPFLLALAIARITEHIRLDSTPMRKPQLLSTKLAQLTKERVKEKVKGDGFYSFTLYPFPLSLFSMTRNPGNYPPSRHEDESRTRASLPRSLRRGNSDSPDKPSVFL